MIIKKKEKSPITPPDEKEMTVRLKNFGGITPSVYLRIFLGILLACGLFFLFFFPGIRREGTVLKVTTRPAGAVVTVNGYYAGTAPANIFLPARARYDVKIEKPGFPVHEKEINAKGRIFATLFFPVKEKIDIVWDKPADPTVCYRQVLAEFNDFALADREYSPSIRKQTAKSFEPNYFFTETLDFFVRDYKGFLTDEEIEKAVLHAAALCTHEVTARAVLKAYTTLYPEYDPVEAADAVLTALNASNPRAALIFRGALPEPLKKQLSVTGMPPAAAPAYRKPQLRPDGSFSAIGERWVFFPQTAAVTAADSLLPPAEITCGGFWIQDREVTAGLYRRFLSDCPEYAAENTAALEEQGLADAFYLRQFPQDNRLPAVSVSWHAAQAFCRWIERQPELSGFRARLPYSFEIALLTADDNPATANIAGSGLRAAGSPQTDSLRDLTGNVWEWCQNPPLRDIAETDSLLLNLPTEIKAVAGGSWKSDTFDPAETGVQFAVWSSPYTGFRVVLEKK